MTVAFAGTWEFSWSAPYTEAILWHELLRDFSVDEWHMTPISGVADYPMREWEQAEGMLDFLRERYTLVFVDENGTTDLRELEHPADAAYVCGKVGRSLFTGCAKPGELSVRVETPAQMGVVWPHQALAIVLYHRSARWLSP